MSRAVECDLCGSLVSTLRAIEIVEVRVPYRTAKGGVAYRGWGADGEELDVCLDCLGRPLGEALGALCAGFAAAVAKAEGGETAVRP